jgi:hypothetical protein
MCRFCESFKVNDTSDYTLIKKRIPKYETAENHDVSVTLMGCVGGTRVPAKRNTPVVSFSNIRIEVISTVEVGLDTRDVFAGSLSPVVLNVGHMVSPARGHTKFQGGQRRMTEN